MTRLFALLALLCLVVAPTTAHDLGVSAPVKPVSQVQPPPPAPDVLRQGGDTFADAVPIPLIYATTGTTVGYTDDYDESCPYENSTSPDVVYTFTPDGDMVINVDMFGSSYDTKIYIYDADLNLVACNDDYYSDYTSFLEQVIVYGGVAHYLVIDGYGGDAGDYILAITQYAPCVLDCPVGAVLEGEPPLENDNVDLWNGGCHVNPADPLLQPVDAEVFCARSGYFLSNGGNDRDTDWLLYTIPSTGLLSIVGMAERPTYLFEMGPQDCNTVGVLQNVPLEPCVEGSLDVIGEPGAEVWIWVGPQGFNSPTGVYPYEYTYFLMTQLPVAVQQSTLTEVKALFE